MSGPSTEPASIPMEVAFPVTSSEAGRKRKAEDEGDEEREKRGETPFSEEMQLSMMHAEKTVDCPLEEDLSDPRVRLAMEDMDVSILSSCTSSDPLTRKYKQQTLESDASLVVSEMLLEPERMSIDHDLVFLNGDWEGLLGEPKYIEKDAKAVQMNEAKDCSEDLVLQEGLEEADVYDDLTGEKLPAELVKKAKLEELREIYRRGVWSERPTEECRTANSAAPHLGQMGDSQ